MTITMCIVVVIATWGEAVCLPACLPLSLSLSLSLSPSLPLSRSLSLSLPPSLPPSLTHSPTLALSLALSVSLSLPLVVGMMIATWVRLSALICLHTGQRLRLPAYTHTHVSFLFFSRTLLLTPSHSLDLF